MSHNNWHVITGGPGTGKTLLINMLANLGYATASEAAREIIDQGLAAGQTLQQIRGDEQTWQCKILTRILTTESSLNPQTPTFFDRGAHDGLAFLQLKGVKPGKYWEPITKSSRQPHYKTVFLLEPLPNFEHDYARTENAQITNRLNDLTAQIYISFGMQPIHIPYLPPQERLELILSHLRSQNALL